MITGSYLHNIRPLPIIFDMRMKESIMTLTSGTFGSISFPYGVMVTWKSRSYDLISSSMYLSIGLGSFVMNDRQSTFCGLRSIRYTTSCATGFLTMTYPSLTLPMNHSEWNAGISVLLLALIITIRDHRPQALSMDAMWMFISSYISSR